MFFGRSSALVPRRRRRCKLCVVLRELHISNLAIIADVHIELDAGLTCFTGQTGAGKSLVIGALELLLALRSPGNMLRAGAVEGRVTGVFHIAAPRLRQELAALTDLPLADEPEMILVRRLHKSGRTSASLNGHPLTGTMLKALGEALADIHGRHDAQFLLQPGNQLAVLDEFGGAAAEAEQFRRLHQQRRDLMDRKRKGETSQTLRRQQLELYEFQIGEIDQADFQPDEQEQLENRHKLLANAEKIKRQAGAAYEALYEDEGAVVERIKTITAVLLEIAELNPDLAAIATQVRDAAVSLDDAAFALRRTRDRLELDPDELANVRERLNLLHRLINKYVGAGGSLSQLLEYRRQIGRDMASLLAADHDSASCNARLADGNEQLTKIGQELSKKRRAAAQKLVPLVHGQLIDLGMKDARFAVELQPIAAETPDHVGPADPGASPADSFPSPQGLETVEFMIAPNPGQEARPLRKIASGGELSRVMLALKSILAASDRVSVLVFDEIDANVGGRMGTLIGEKLRRLAAHHQVLCITHLPQIAAFADQHISIHKSVRDGESFTSITMLEGETRVRELAEMTTGKNVTDTALAQAKELLALASRNAADGKESAGKTRRIPGKSAVRNEKNR